MTAKDCHGNCIKHCCFFRGVVCPYLEEDTIPGRRWACGLLRDNGNNWNRMLRDNRYETTVQALYDTVPELVGENCRDWNCPGVPEA